MRNRLKFLSAGTLAACTVCVFAATVSMPTQFADPREFRVYESFEGADAEAPLPDDYKVPGELVVGRLMYPSYGRGFFGGYDWHDGQTGWTDDYPRGDRALIQMLRRNTRINVRAVEQPVSVDDGDDIFYWPFMIVGLAQSWNLSDAQARKLRDYLQRGGFMYCDSFYGENNWDAFEYGLKKVFPDRDIRQLTDDEVVFHIAFDLPHMTQVQIPHFSPGFGFGSMEAGNPPHWKGVFDDDGRLMVLISHNNDVGDGWQWADDPRYPGDEANRALRIGSNAAIYAMTH